MSNNTIGNLYNIFRFGDTNIFQNQIKSLTYKPTFKLNEENFNAFISDFKRILNFYYFTNEHHNEGFNEYLNQNTITIDDKLDFIKIYIKSPIVYNYLIDNFIMKLKSLNFRSVSPNSPPITEAEKFFTQLNQILDKINLNLSFEEKFKNLIEKLTILSGINLTNITNSATKDKVKVLYDGVQTFTYITFIEYLNNIKNNVDIIANTGGTKDAHCDEFVAEYNKIKSFITTEIPVSAFIDYIEYEENDNDKQLFKILYVLYNLDNKNKNKIDDKDEVVKSLKPELLKNTRDINDPDKNKPVLSIEDILKIFDIKYNGDNFDYLFEFDKTLDQTKYIYDEPKKSKIGEKLDKLIGDDKQKPKDPSKIIDLKDKNGRFIRTGENAEIIKKFAKNCLLNTDPKNKKNCFVNGIIGTGPDSVIYHTLVNNIEVLRPDQLKALAWQLDLQKRLGRYESKKEWLDRYGNVMVERVVDKERSKGGETVYKYGGAIAEFMRKDDNDDNEYNYFVTDDKEQREKRYKNCEEIFKFKCCLIDTLSNALNKNIYNADMKKDNDNTITSYNVAQSNRIIQNPYTIYNVPSLYWFMGGRYQFDENKTTAKELRRIYNNIKTNLESRNKIISQTDDESIIKAIDKIEEIEKQIGKILTNGFNYLQTVKDNNKKKITLDNLQQQVTEQATKALSMKEKLDKIVNYLVRESEKNGETLDDKSTLNDYYDGEWY